MKNLKIYGIMLLSLVMMFGITGCLEVTGDDGDDATQGTIGVSIVNQATFADKDVYFTIGADPQNPDASADFTLTGNSGSWATTEATFWDDQNYTLNVFVDMNGNDDGTGPDGGDYYYESTTVAGASTVDLVLADFTEKPCDLTITFTAAAAVEVNVEVFAGSLTTTGETDVATAITSATFNEDATMTFDDLFDDSSTYTVLAWYDDDASGDFNTDDTYVINQITIASDDALEIDSSTPSTKL